MADLYLFAIGAGSDVTLRQINQTAPADTTRPTFTGALSATSTLDSITVDWSGTTSADNVAVARREYSINGGAYVSASAAEETAKSHVFSGLTSSTVYRIDVRCVDTSGNTSDPLTITITTGAIAPRFARPASTIASGGWVSSDGGDLAAAINEQTADSTRHIKATAPGMRCSMKANPVAAPSPTSRHVIRYQAWSDSGDGLKVYLMQGAVQIGSWPHVTLPKIPTVYAQTLSEMQVASITDYANLRFDYESI